MAELRAIRRVLGVALVLGAVATTTAVQAQPVAANNVPPRAGNANLAELEARRQILFNRMLADPSDLDTSFEYAALSSQVGDLEGSIATLERMLIFAPGLPRLQLELGVLYFRLGALDTARNYFETVAAAPNVPDDVRTRINSYLAQIDQKATGRSLNGVVSVGGRYQSNANGAPSNRTVNLNGLDFVLSDSAMAGADVNATAALTLNYSQGLSAQGDRFDAVLTALGSLYADRSELGIGVVEVSAGPSFDLSRFGLENTSLGIYGIAGGAILDSSPFMASAGVGAALLNTVTPNTRLSLRGEYRREAYANTAKRPTNSTRDGDRYRATAGIEHKLNDAVTLFASTSLERRAAQVNFASLWEASVQGGVNVRYDSPIKSLPSPWSLTLAGTVATRVSDGPDRLVSTQPETGQDWTISATNTMPLADDIALQAQLSYRWVTSNYDTRRFDNLTAGLTLQKRF